jgi:hypothetical protein
MSIDLHEEAGGKILVVNVSGTLTNSAYKRFARQAERLIKEHGKLRMLCQMDHFHGWEAGALREDLEFDLKHLGDIERLAFITDRASENGVAAFYKPFVAAEVRYFDESRADEARQWVYADLPGF